MSFPRRLRCAILVLAAGLAILGGCGRIGFDPATSADDAVDAIPPDGDGGPGVYNDVSDGTNWTTFDTRTVDGGAAGFYGAAFDGRYVYLIPSYNGTLNGIVARLDTQADFGTPAAWTTFDTTTVHADARGFHGASFDGRYLYLVPHEDLGGAGGVVARYDTQAGFAAPSSWSTFDTATLNPNAVGFSGAVFDGRHVYLVPYQGGTMARYDTQASFTSAAAWSTFALTSVAPLTAYIAGAFDGRYIYLAPFLSGASTSAVVMRHDTQAGFTSAAAWSTFTTTTLDPSARGYGGVAFDGRHVYLVPFLTAPGEPTGFAVRYDNQASFASAAAWATFDATTVNPGAKGFIGGAFDGRHVYFSPYPSGIVTRVDTTTSFASPAAWATFDSDHRGYDRQGLLRRRVRRPLPLPRPAHRQHRGALRRAHASGDAEPARLLRLVPLRRRGTSHGRARGQFPSLMPPLIWPSSLTSGALTLIAGALTLTAAFALTLAAAAAFASTVAR